MMKWTLWMAGMLAAASCNGADALDQLDQLDQIDSQAQEQIMLNQLTLDQLVSTLTGTVEALDALTSSSLSSASFGQGTFLGPLLVDPNARAFMHHLVGCALEPGQSVSWTDAEGTVYEWEGAYGLCPDWATGAPSVACQEIVSACLLAKNNAHGRRVSVSMRGDALDATALPLVSAVPAGTHVELSTGPEGARVASFDECEVEKSGAQRDCGWPAALAFVGQCPAPDPEDPNAVPVPVSVGAGAPAPGDCNGPVLGAASGDLVMRVCEGVSGCNGADALAESEGSCGLSEPALTFECPDSGIFTVMLAPWQSGDQDASGWAEASAVAALPAAEDELFHIREGAFYGNLFASSGLSTDISVHLDRYGRPVREVRKGGTIVVFEDLWACFDPGWKTPSALMHERLCATYEETDLCAATLLGSCEEAFRGGPVTTRCELGHADLGYRGCTDAKGVVRERVITAVLKDACDLVPALPSSVCERI